MIIGTIELDPEDPTKQIKITDDIGFNPSRRNIIRNQKYSVLSLIPVVLWNQFKFFSNLFFY